MITLKKDICVAGAGLAGICTAISAARHGLNVVLINDRSVLGGNASSEIGVGVSGASHHSLNPAIYAKETGLVSEFRNKLLEYTSDGGMGMHAALDAVFFDWVYAEKNIELLLNTTVYGCEKDGNKISACFARHTFSNEEYRIESDFFTDATGNGILAFEAGATYRMGREGKSEFNEFWAPDTEDKYTMGATLFFESEDAGREVGYRKPDFAYDISGMDFVKDINKPENFRGFSVKAPHWTYEYGGQCDTIYDSEKIDLELRRLIYGIWDYIKTSGKYPEAKTMTLKRVFAKTGARESRRFEGDYILSENDIEQKVNFRDSVCIGGWPMDIHAPLGIYDSAPASNFVSVTGIYNIPLRSLYSKDIDNLFLAGRDISATHIALGSTRVMATCGAIGQAVGTAGYICKKYGITPRVAASDKISEIQETLLFDDQTIAWKKDCIDGGFTATATCEKVFENTDTNGFMACERDYVLALMCDNPRMDTVELNFKATADTKIKYKLLHGIHPETFLPDHIVKCGEIEICKGFEGWISVPVDCESGEDGKIYIVIEKNSNLLLGICEDRPIGAVTLRMHTEQCHDGKNHDSVPLNLDSGYSFLDHTYEFKRNIAFREIMPKSHMYSADKVINGFSRPYKTANIWIAQKEFPQALTLKATEPVSAQKLNIIFDDYLESDFIKEFPSCLVKSFTLNIISDSGTTTITENQNYQRNRIFDINATNIKEISITINESFGGDAGIYGIRLLGGSNEH